MSRVPSGRDYLVSYWVPVFVGILTYFLVAILGLAASQIFLPTAMVPVGVLVSLGLAFVCLSLPLIRQNRLDSSYTDVKVINRLAKVIEVAEAVEDEVTSHELRLQLAKEVHRAANYFERAFRRLNGLEKATQKDRRRLARQTSVVLHRYASTAVHGDIGAITSLKEDFARAILRVGSGNWPQVAHLNSSVPEKRRFLDFLPVLDPKWIAALAGALVLQLIQIASKIPK